jgi:hypothetical protein
VLYRLFPWDPAADAAASGGALFNPRAQQGSGRHDNPHLYGALYVARVEVSAVAEWLVAFRGQSLAADDFVRTDGRRWGLVGLDDSGLPDIVDLDDPSELAARGLRPSRVATRVRSTTQEVAGTLFAEGIPGFGWWSTLEASWPNVTLFAERALPALRVADGPREIAIDHPIVRAAAAAIGVTLS